jgi:hypothetical protein
MVTTPWESVDAVVAGEDTEGDRPGALFDVEEPIEAGGCDVEVIAGNPTAGPAPVQPASTRPASRVRNNRPGGQSRSGICITPQ